MDTVLSLWLTKSPCQRLQVPEPECHICVMFGQIASVCKPKSVKIFQRSIQANKKHFGSKHQYPDGGQRMNKVTVTNVKQKLPGEMDELQIFTIGQTTTQFCANIVVNDKKTRNRN